MAQIDIFQKERGQAKKVQEAFTPKPPEAAKPQPKAAEPEGPGVIDRAASYAADKLVPQKGTIPTKPKPINWSPDLSKMPWKQAVAKGK